MPTAFLTRRDVRLPQLSVNTNFDRDSAKEVMRDRLREAKREPSPDEPALMHQGPPE